MTRRLLRGAVILVIILVLGSVLAYQLYYLDLRSNAVARVDAFLQR